MAEPRAPLFTPAFIALSLAELAYFTCAGVIILATPLFAHEALGADEAGAGLAVGAFSVTALLLRPVAGRVSDRIGRRPLLVGGALSFAAATAAQALATDIAVVVALRLVQGAAEAFFFVSGFAALADLAPPHRAGEALSFNSLSLYLGITFGPALGQWLISVGSFQLAFVGGAGLAALAALLALRIPETASRGDGERPPTPILHRAALGPGFILFLGVCGMAVFLAFVPIDAKDIGLAGAGNVLFVFGAVVVASRVVFAKLPDRVSPLRLAGVALLLIATGLLLASTVRAENGLLVGAAIMGFGVAFLTPACFAAIFARVPPEERGSASGTASIFLDLAFGGGPMLLGLVAAGAGIAASYAVVAALALLGSVISLAGPSARRSLRPAT